MFDPETTALVHRAAPLPQLDWDRLPQELTKAFASLASFRLRLARGSASLPDDLQTKLNEFRRMAATYETLVALLPDRDDRKATAFVAAHAQQLLHLARVALAPNTERPTPLRDDAISPEVSALLLFLIANQPSDALEMARVLMQTRPRSVSSAALLVDGLVALATGRLTEIVFGTRQQLPLLRRF